MPGNTEEDGIPEVRENPFEKRGLAVMISRHWRGVAKPERADSYISHLQNDTFPQLATIDGFISASIMKREVDRGTEFLVITRWESIHAIELFAGQAIDDAVVPASVQEMMIDYDRKVIHYEVIEDHKRDST